jgi:hypothetical protein
MPPASACRAAYWAVGRASEMASSSSSAARKRTAGRSWESTPRRARPASVTSSNSLGCGLEVFDGLFVADLEDAQDAVDAEPVAGGVGFRLILREHRDQAVRVPVGLGGGRQDDAAPAVVDREQADPGVAGVLRPGEVAARLRVPGEGGDGGVDGSLDGLVELRVLA